METALISVIVALLTSILTSLITIHLSRQRLEREYQLEFATEKVAHELMNHPEWTKRSFMVIKHHLHGFEDDELRKTLIRAGAIRFEDPKNRKELWGLLSRNTDSLGMMRDPDDPDDGEDMQVRYSVG